MGIAFCVCHQEASAQPGKVSRPPLVIKGARPEAKLVDQFGRLNSEERSARFDVMFAGISQTPNSIGYVFLFCGKTCRYDEIVGHMRGIEIKIALRRFERSKLVILDGGFRESFETELWVVPEEACPPTPKSNIHIRNVIFTGAIKGLKEWIESYDCCDDYTNVWKNLKP